VRSIGRDKALSVYIAYEHRDSEDVAGLYVAVMQSEKVWGVDDSIIGFSHAYGTDSNSWVRTRH
jgi:hypothetical protein